MQIKKRWITILLLGILLIGCGGGSGGKNSSFDTSGNNPIVDDVVVLDENSTNVYSVEQNATDIVAYVRENIEDAFIKVIGKDKSTITYMLSGGDYFMCRIDPLSGELAFLSKTDYEKKSLYKFNVVLDDSHYQTIKRVTIYVLDEKNENIIIATDVNSSLPIDSEQKYFITKWSVKSDNGYKLTIPTLGDGYNYSVDWGDEHSSNHVTSRTTHTYDSEQIYTVKIVGDFPRIQVNNVYAEWSDGYIKIKSDADNNNSKLVSVEQWGNIKWKSMRFAFPYTELAINAIDNPDLSNVTDMTGMFYSARGEGVFNFKINSWDTSSIENMSHLFESSHFNGDISEWDVSNVENMRALFLNTRFDQDISNWDVSKVQDMSVMFLAAEFFNQNISSWDVSHVQKMGGMFAQTYFNQDISSWDVSKVQDMSGMFAKTDFNQDIGSWDVSNVIDMSMMFYSSISFNKDIGNWDVSKVKNMSSMFNMNNSFNQNLEHWNVTTDVNTSRMFENATALEVIPSWYKE